ncbi:MAG: hypothetical protein JWO38_5020 [Gemmataceae bacterium]|nr:hypothetical protein [Gemmataceae bacterium]
MVNWIEGGVTEPEPVIRRSTTHQEPAANKVSRLSVIVDDLEVAIKVGDLGRIINGVCDLRRLVWDAQDTPITCC